MNRSLTVPSFVWLIQCVTAQRAAAKFWCSSPVTRAKSCQRVMSYRRRSGVTSGGRAKRSTGAKWRDETLSTRWSSSWQHWLLVHRRILCLQTPCTIYVLHGQTTTAGQLTTLISIRFLWRLPVPIYPTHGFRSAACFSSDLKCVYTSEH